MNKPKDGGPAFPLSTLYSSEQSGMTLRDYFAAQALVGLLIRDDGWQLSGNPDARDAFAIDAYDLADAMLKQHG